MVDVKWIKIVVDIFDDEKIKLIEVMPEADGIIVIWFKILCLAGKQNMGGVLMLNDRIAFTDEMLSTLFRRPINTIRLALKVFEQYGMIEVINNTVTIPNWEKHQSLDGLERSKEQSRIRSKQYRERQKLLAEQNGVTDRHVMETSRVTPGNGTDIEEDKELDIDTSSKGSAPAKSKIIKHSHGEYGWVKLTEAEYDRLLKELGADELARCIRYVDESAQGNRNKNKWSDWNLVVRRCHREGWGLRGKAVIRNEPKQRQYSGDGFKETV